MIHATKVSAETIEGPRGNMLAMETLYRRPLPVDAIAFSSPEGRQVFAEALAAGGLDGYFPLAEQFHTQADPSFCGLGSLVVALNALAIDPGRLWKGPWRWFAEDLLDCCVPLSEVRRRGLDIDELGCLARCNGAEVQIVRADATNLQSWRSAIRAASRAESVLVASYDRGAIGQTGSGHFSPIGGYHAARDVALVLDVARFKYPPHWVSAERLFHAMQPVDLATGRSRGWMILHRRERGIALGFSLQCEGDSWDGLGRRLDAVLAELAAATDLGSMARAVAPLTPYLEQRTPSATAHRDALAAARTALRETAVYRIIAGVVGAELGESVTLLLCALSDFLSAPQRADLTAVMNPVQGDTALGAELTSLGAQLAALRTMKASPGEERAPAAPDQSGGA